LQFVSIEHEQFLVSMANNKDDFAIVTQLQGLYEAALPKTEFSTSLLDAIREAYQPGAGMADAFGRWLETTLGSRGLVLYDASDPASKPLAADLFARDGDPTDDPAVVLERHQQAAAPATQPRRISLRGVFNFGLRVDDPPDGHPGHLPPAPRR